MSLLPPSLRRAVGLGLLAVAIFPAPALAWTGTRTQGGVWVAWENSCPVFHPGRNTEERVPRQMLDDALASALQTWTDVDCSPLAPTVGPLLEDAVAEMDKCGGNVNVVTVLERWPYIDEALAYTTITYFKDDGVILDADIEVNGEGYQFTNESMVQVGKVDLQAVLLHELGHCWGLEHSDVTGSAMYFQVNPGDSTRRELVQDDVDGLCTLNPAGRGECTGEAGDGDERLASSCDDGFCSLSTGSRGSTASGAVWLPLLAGLALLLARRMRRPGDQR